MKRAEVMTKIVRPLAKGQITIPVGFRRKLGIDEQTLLTLTLRESKIEITPLRVGPAEPLRDYTDEEIARFLEEDRIDVETAKRVRDLLVEGSL